MLANEVSGYTTDTLCSVQVRAPHLGICPFRFPPRTIRSVTVLMSLSKKQKQQKAIMALTQNQFPKLITVSALVVIRQI